MSRKNKQIISRILVAIFAIYYANICFFYHSHVVNGVTVVHSHFHGKTHTQPGIQHTDSELTLISALSAFLSLQAAAGAGLGAFLLLLAMLGALSRRSVVFAPAVHVSLRAPPALL